MKKPLFLLSTLALIASVTVSLLFSSCATQSHFAVSTIDPAAEGDISIIKDNNRNYVIKIKVYNLAEPTRLTPPMNAYVVWLVTDDNRTKNMGQIVSSTKFMTKNLHANFEAVSSSKPVKIFITSENDVTVINPSFSQIILTTSYLKKP